jgi:hypothetical protein
MSKLIPFISICKVLGLSWVSEELIPITMTESNFIDISLTDRFFSQLSSVLTELAIIHTFDYPWVATVTRDNSHQLLASLFDLPAFISRFLYDEREKCCNERLDVDGLALDEDLPEKLKNILNILSGTIAKQL